MNLFPSRPFRQAPRGAMNSRRMPIPSSCGGDVVAAGCNREMDWRGLTMSWPKLLLLAMTFVPTKATNRHPASCRYLTPLSSEYLNGRLSAAIKVDDVV